MKGSDSGSDESPFARQSGMLALISVAEQSQKEYYLTLKHQDKLIDIINGPGSSRYYKGLKRM